MDRVLRWGGTIWAFIGIVQIFLTLSESNIRSETFIAFTVILNVLIYGIPGAGLYWMGEMLRLWRFNRSIEKPQSDTDDWTLGQASPASIVCPSCSARNPEGADYCQRCGSRLAGSKNASPSSTEMQPPPAPSIEGRLQKLQTLLEKGLITQEEYEGKRKKILDEL